MEPEGASDRELLALVAAGDNVAFGLLYDRLVVPAYSLAHYMLRDSRWAEDVVQEAFMNIWRLAASYDARRGTVKAWALTTVRNRTVDHLRRQGARPRTVGPIDPDALFTAPDTVWEETSRSLDAEVVQAAMAAIPEEQRRVLEMAYFGGLSQQEIAAATGLPLGTVKGRMRLGLGKLRDSLAEQGMRELR